jgi:hypothetical protein
LPTNFEGSVRATRESQGIPPTGFIERIVVEEDKKGRSRREGQKQEKG